MKTSGEKQFQPGDVVWLKNYGTFGGTQGVVTQGYHGQKCRVPVQLEDGKIVEVGHDRLDRVQ
jgi:hypothetical protein